MKKNISIKILMLTLVLASLLCINTKVSADDSTSNGTIVYYPNTINILDDTNKTNVQSNNNTTITQTANTLNTTTNKIANNTNANLPKTGLEDFTAIFVIITISIISAIYAYKKVNEYKDLK